MLQSAEGPSCGPGWPFRAFPWDLHARFEVQGWKVAASEKDFEGFAKQTLLQIEENSLLKR